MPFPNKTFNNEKKLYLSKQDRSKKGEIDEQVLPLLKIINAHDDYYTTSSCSGRVYLWQGSGKKNEVKWLRVSHELIDERFFDIKYFDLENADIKEGQGRKGLIWLRLEPFILHLACKDIAAANRLVELARQIYKKSCLLTISNKIIVEVRGSEFIEMPWWREGELLFIGDKGWLVQLINEKLESIGQGIRKFAVLLKKIP